MAAPGADLPPARRSALDSSGAVRTTLVIGIRNEPGALLRALAVFADHGLNLSALESRPARDRPWEYVFWVDLDADATEPDAQAALAELAGVTTLVRVLGSYFQAAGG